LKPAAAAAGPPTACTFATDLPFDRDNAELAACGRARRKIGNESFNVFKRGSYNLEHNFGHG
jgi:hypothetical protein